MTKAERVRLLRQRFNAIARLRYPEVKPLAKFPAPEPVRCWRKPTWAYLNFLTPCNQNSNRPEWVKKSESFTVPPLHPKRRETGPNPLIRIAEQFSKKLE
jgi:hypothetical protein